MLPVVLFLLSQAPAPGSAAVLVASKRPGADAPAKTVAARMTSAAGAAGFTVAADAVTAKALKKAKLNPRDCQGATACLQKSATALGAVVFGVDVGKIGDSLAIHVEAVNAAGSLGALDVPVDGNLKPADLDALEAFAKSVASTLAPASSTPPVATAAPKPAPADAPKPATLEPAPAAPPSATVVLAKPPPPAGRSGIRKAVPWLVGAGAVAALGVGGAFLGLGAQEKAKFDASVTGGVSRLPGSELQALSARGNFDFTVGFSTAAVGVGLAALAALLFAL